MPAKNTVELENELTEADDVKKFLDDNAENFRDLADSRRTKNNLRGGLQVEQLFSADEQNYF